MKKLMLLCFVIILSVNLQAQETTAEKKAAKDKTEKLAKAKKEKAETAKNKVATAKDKAAITKEKTTKDKVETAKEKAATSKKTAKNKVQTAKNKATTAKEKATSAKPIKKIKETNEKAPKVADKITGEYNGKKVYTGPRGGKYYINSNGNKTYLQDLFLHKIKGKGCL